MPSEDAGGGEYHSMVLIPLAPDLVAIPHFRCVYHMRALLDSGTLGTKCHNESIIPSLTATWVVVLQCVTTCHAGWDG